ncbi:DNA polymerase II [Shewanella sp. C32]|uniref:DNA polymerase n=1 Tax=Shewanella electrica TaxID=515560 RepID=A0ABT2FGT9_9GAMM|nr:DNA polymerase II [Shewanella electrica]MCH1923438.1 DNA polymerase II [Shewanella electrica]MCS4555535.1 DNA polymerase II [Shewanella electrica]
MIPQHQTISGRVLTRHWVQRPSGAVLQYYLNTADGAVLVEVAEGQQIFFANQRDASMLAQQQHGLTARPIALKSFQSEPVAALYSASASVTRQTIARAKDLAITLYETEIKPQQRFLIERFIAFEAEFYGYFDNQDSSDCSNKFIATRARSTSIDAAAIAIKMVSFDLECGPDGQLYSAAVYGADSLGHAQVAQVFMIGAPEASEQDIHWVADEKALLLRLMDWFQTWDPDVIIGWSVIGFDLALLSKRCQLLGIAPQFGRLGQPLGWLVEGTYRPETLSLPGRVVLDGIDWLKAAFYQFDSFSLDFVAHALLGEGKTIAKDNKVAEINRQFREEKTTLAYYNLTDCRLVWDIFVKTDLLNFAMARAQLTGLEFGRAGASVAAFNNLYLPHLHRAGFVAPAMPASNGLESPGGYVMDSIPGLYRDILVLDFKSLYPSIIRTFLVDPLGLVTGFTEDDKHTVAGFRGARFSREGHILPGLVGKLADAREHAKREQNAALSQAIKIIMNSLYGVLGSRGCVFHDAKLASSITMRGHQIMQQTKAWIEELGYTVIYGDTDSTFVWLGEQHNVTDCEVFGRELAAQITEKWRSHIQQHYQLPSYLELEFDNHFSRFFMPTLRGSDAGSKKRYVGMKRDKSGNEQLVFKGMEQVRSDWTPLAKRIQHELYWRLFHDTDVTAYLREQIAAIHRGDCDAELVFTRRLRRDIQDYQSQAIPHVKAAQRLVESTQDPRHGKRGAVIHYVITTSGAIPTAITTNPPDYDYYVDKQLRPIAEPVLNSLNVKFEDLINKQICFNI